MRVARVAANIIALAAVGLADSPTHTLADTHTPSLSAVGQITMLPACHLRTSPNS